jgi:superfamily II DNA helicase RecQ
LNALKLPLNVSQYRQFTGFIASVHLRKQNESENQDSQEEVFDQQTGHTTRTARVHYGIDTRNHIPTVSQHLLADYYLVSKEWHELFKLNGSFENEGDDFYDALSNDNIIQPAKTYISNEITSEMTFTSSDYPSFTIHVLAILQKLHGPSGLIVDGDQMKALYHMSQRKDAIIILPTGAGKTFNIMVLHLLYPGKSIVYIPAFKSVLENMRSLALRHKIPVLELNDASDIEGENPPGIILVQVEMVDKYLPLLSKLVRTEFIHCIILDECHEILLSQHFRPSFGDLKLLRLIGVPLICMSATLPKNREIQLITELGLQPNVYRKSSNRPNLRYLITSFDEPSEGLQYLNLSIYESHQLTQEGRGIIYCRTHDMVDIIVQFMNSKNMPSFPYSRGMESVSQDLSLRNWQLTPASWLIATSAYGTGVSYDNVNSVIFYDLPYSVEQLVQGFGRAGRGGNSGVCELIFSKQELLSHQSNLYWFESMQILTDCVKELTRNCVRFFLTLYMDGNGVSCYEDLKNSTCQNCLERKNNYDDQQAPVLRMEKSPISALGSIMQRKLVNETLNVYYY